jgi:glycosyltransferase involved in cell wall biosynthesis
MMRALKRTNPLVAFNLRSYLEKLIEMHRPDFIWAQHFQPTLVATRQRNVPVVYSHHDWLYRIKALRHGRPEDAAQRTQEHEVVRRCNAAVCGSATERGELIAAGCPNVAYLPVSYKPVPVDMGALDTNSPRLVHLGGMGTTANREGLRRFFEIVWPLVSELGLSLDVVGDLSGSSDCLMASLNRANCLGFVPDLSTVLRPGDIHVIAWEHNTGQRTRFPLALNHGQVVVATRASVACFPEARDGENCRLVPRLEDMAVVLKELVADKNQRQRLAISGRDTFLRSFTREAMLPRYEELLESLPLRANGQPLATKRTDGDAIQRTHKGNPQPYETIR